VLVVGLAVAIWLGLAREVATTQPIARAAVANAQSGAVELVQPADPPVVDAPRPAELALTTMNASIVPPQPNAPTDQASPPTATERAPRRSKRRARASLEASNPAPQPQQKSAAELLGF
jgi:hypothetical protein